MVKRYKCPKHKENTPSAIVYGDYYYCFGCSARGSIEELGLSASDVTDDRYVEDLNETLKYARGLPHRNIRGLDFPSDGGGYFILWPDSTYYKYRRFDSGSDKAKYRNPAGHSQTLFVAKNKTKGDLIVIEGEINALSIAQVADCGVVSPGGVGNFSGKKGDDVVKYARPFDRVFIICDNDNAGASAAMKLKIALVASGKHKTFIELWNTDANDILTTHGREKLKQNTDHVLEMSPRVQRG